MEAVRITIMHRDPEGAVFAADAWDGQVGKTVPFKLEDEQISTATLVAATVVDGGGAVELTLEVPDRPQVLTGLSPMSFGFSRGRKP